MNWTSKEAVLDDTLVFDYSVSFSFIKIRRTKLTHDVCQLQLLLNKPLKYKL